MLLGLVHFFDSVLLVLRLFRLNGGIVQSCSHLIIEGILTLDHGRIWASLVDRSTDPCNGCLSNPI